MAVDTITGAGAAPYVQQQLAGQTKALSSMVPDGETNTQETANFSAGQPGDQVRLNHSAATTKNLDTARSIEQMHAQLNQLAKGVRETNEGLVQAAEKSEQMRSTLQSIMKNYPPFPADSIQRQEILMSYVSIRKEIEQLMIPPPPQPVYEKVKHMWDSMFSQNGQMLPSAIPALTSSSSDQQLKDAAKGLDKSSERLALLSTGITDSLMGR